LESGDTDHIVKWAYSASVWLMESIVGVQRTCGSRIALIRSFDGYDS
jgi:hypothetical protein